MRRPNEHEVPAEDEGSRPMRRPSVRARTRSAAHESKESTRSLGESIADEAQPRLSSQPPNGPKRPSARAPAGTTTTSTVGRSSAAPTPGREKALHAEKPRARARATESRPVAVAPGRSSSPTSTANTDEGVVVVTGICGRLGQIIARELHRVTSVVGIDRRPFVGKPKDIVHYQIDLRRKKTQDVFRAGNVRAVVHMGVLHNPRASDKEHHSWNVVAFQKLLGYMEQYEVPKLVVLSSANVYGPQPDNPQFLSEDAPLLGAQTFRGMRDLIELDMLAQSYYWRHPKTETVILRPCHILGRTRNAPSNYFRLDRPVMILGYDPMVQVIHERDVVRAVMLALEPGVRGIFNLRGPGELPLSRLLRRLGKKPLHLPATIAQAAVERLWRYRLSSFPAAEIDHIRYLCMVDDARARELLGFRPEYSLDETLRAVYSDR